MLSAEKAKSNKLEKEVAEMQSGIEFLKKYVGLADAVETEEDCKRMLDTLEAIAKEKAQEGKTAKFPKASGILKKEKQD